MGIETAIVGAAVVGAAASSSSADASAGASKKAARAAADSAKYQTDVQKEIFDQQREDQGPWRDVGASAVNELAVLMGLPPASSGYKTYDEWYEELKPYYETTTTKVEDPVPITQETRDADGMLTLARTIDPNYGRPTSEYKSLDQEALRLAVEAKMREQQAALDRMKSSPNFGQLRREFDMNAFTADPGYAFRQAEGQKAIDRQAAARGGLISGGALKATQRFGQELASQEYGNAYGRFMNNQEQLFNRLSGLAGTGQVANDSLGQAGRNYANAVSNISSNNATMQGNALLAGASARSSGYQGVANAFSNAVQNWPTQQQSFGTTLPAQYNNSWSGAGFAGNGNGIAEWA